jgi:hypothetical protein
MTTVRVVGNEFTKYDNLSGSSGRRADNRDMEIAERELKRTNLKVCKIAYPTANIPKQYTQHLTTQDLGVL